MADFAAPRKSLGQNFLQDPNIIRKIVDSLAVKATDTVLEIGPGRGALTELLLPLAAHLHLVEFDRDLVQYWASRNETNLTVHGADILQFDLTPVLSNVDSIKVIGNLPYNISSPVLFHLLQYADRIASQVVMLQKEVVDRMAAQPGSKQYGRLSVMLQQRYHIESLFTVPATAFFPPPKVESAIARLTPLDRILHPVASHADFAAMVKQAFSMRRKTLRNNLKPMLNATQISALEIDPSARAETLTVAEFAALANAFSTQQSETHSKA
ncbi:ribosomal RNA small subunit methyltransferase A [Arenicella chitinivorans]|uniref:Ribosomal RNA small subunit methyltransferase A n=1 Tax=Arenicella chitinivorans TaxID=1329800 RepID=A0A918S146_9GAMM|nr:16S rRNA (adenine(1518)-N(6)/adenine(1519)-N(6))-dimethyltransferase RsmA [Arenicella chitinivorans]GHA18631.1 ribosomal RNA small subunit methyltransferase A [Arenicella chitinivorans]